MNHGSDIVVRLVGGRRVEAQLGRHRVVTDQPRGNGGEDTAPSPFQLFLASLGTCAGVFVQGFCANRGIRYETIQLIEHPTFTPDGGLQSVEFEVRVPPEFPPNYREALRRVIDQCSVKQAIESPPEFRAWVSDTALAVPRPG